MPSEIPFHKPFFTGMEVTNVASAIASTGLRSDGHFTQRCTTILKERFGIPELLMVGSCSAALEMAAMLCGLRSGDEVILPSFTFASTANAFIRLGARPVFVEIRRDNLNIDESLIEAAITPRTRAIFPVHYGGVPCEMDRLMAIARRYNLFVVEDAAQAVNAFYKGRALGTIGDFGAYSFHNTKDYTAGEGGALCLSSSACRSRAEIIREKGTNRNKFLRGEVDRYTWVDVGSSYAPSEVACAVLCAQLQAMDKIRKQRYKVWQYYHDGLEACEARGWLQLPRIRAESQPNYHIFYVLLPDQRTRDRLQNYLLENGIHTQSHYVPLHCSPMGARYGYGPGDLPLTEELSGRLLRLPTYPSLKQNEQSRLLRSLVAHFHGISPHYVEASRRGKKMVGVA